MDRPRLAELARKDPIARVIFDHLAERHRNAPETTVDNMVTTLARNGHQVDRYDVVRVFRQLEEAGCGSFVLGRKGHPSRFIWEVPMIDVGRAAISDVPRPADKAETKVEQKTAKPGEETLEHTYILRQDFVISLSLPSDLTSAEANRLAEFIRTLPFA